MYLLQSFHCSYGSLGVFGVEDGTAGYQYICARRKYLGGVLGVDAAVYFDECLQPSAVYLIAHIAYFLYRLGDKGLPAKAGIDRHQQHHIYLVEIGVEAVYIDVGIDSQAGMYAFATDKVERRQRVVGRLEVKPDAIRTRIAEPLYIFLGVYDHQVYIERLLAILVHRYHKRKTERDIGDKRTVHHIHMQPIGIAAVYHLEFFP